MCGSFLKNFYAVGIEFMHLCRINFLIKTSILIYACMSFKYCDWKFHAETLSFRCLSKRLSTCIDTGSNFRPKFFYDDGASAEERRRRCPLTHSKNSGWYRRFAEKWRWIPSFCIKIPTLTEFFVLISTSFKKCFRDVRYVGRIPKTKPLSRGCKLEEKLKLDNLHFSIFSVKKSFNPVYILIAYIQHKIHSFSSEKWFFNFFWNKNSSTKLWY